MISDKQMCDFLYSMLAQLEVRNIDWTAIAKEHKISNAHAARMRWHRFKAQKGGSTPKARSDKQSRKEGLEASPSKKWSMGCKSPRCKAGGRDCVQDQALGRDDDVQSLDLTPTRPKTARNDDQIAVWPSMVKREEADVKLPPRVWDRTPTLLSHGVFSNPTTSAASAYDML